MSKENVVATFFISGNTPSSKNGRVWTGSSFLPSAYTRKWIKTTRQEWIDQREKFREALNGLGKPYNIEFTFVRQSRHKFDHINICQGPCDQMKEYGWIDDDNSDEITPYFGEYRFSKSSPGLIIKILRTKPNHYDIQTHTRTDK